MANSALFSEGSSYFEESAGLYTVNEGLTHNKCYARTTEFGGLFGKGQATVSVAITTGAASASYRLVDEDGTTPVGDGSYTTFSSGEAFNLVIPANAQWYKLQLLLDGETVTHSSRFGCGGVTMMNGQSLIQRVITVPESNTITAASLGIVATPFHTTFLSTNTLDAQWLQQADDGVIQSAFIAEYVNRKVEETGVMWAICGHAKGGEVIGNFIPNGSEWPKMEIVYAETDWHEWIWFQGHSDSNTTSSTYTSRLETLNNEVDQRNNLQADKLIGSIPNIYNTGANSGYDERLNKIRLAQKDYCDANGITYTQPNDLKTVSDGVHPTEPANVVMAHHFLRAFKGTDLGPLLTGFTRNGAELTLYFNFADGSDQFEISGDISDVIKVALSTTRFSYLPIDSTSVSENTIVITLVDDPATDDLVIWTGSTNTNDGSSYIRDNYTYDGYGTGRSMVSTIDVVDGEMVYSETDARVIDTTPPVVTNNGPSTITITVGDAYTPDFSTNEGMLSIDNPVDTNTPDTYTVTATSTDAAGNVGSATQTVIVEEEPVNQPPTANAGPDQSVAAATQFTLDGTGSQDIDGTIVEWRWTQTTGDTVTLDLEDPARPTATSPSKTTAQRLTFQLVTVDDEDAVSSPSLVNIDVAAVVQNDVLNIIDKISFTFESDGMITAFPGRANRETFRLKPSDPTGLVLEDGWFDFEANDVRRVEISMLETTGVKIISTDTDSITREKSKLHVRMGDMPIKSSTKEFEPTVSVFVGDDERGVVMTAPGLSGAPKVKYYSTTARAV
ncbi:PKD domain-containing protein [Alteromonas australica]|uniref:PKD domain-containing protein n=1 Tax=Alteromonas australica TaxID=589873 RepID=UPI002356B723|nr:sialate O-acetylesterase [Alteromonas australica]|tara:strand:+ start:4203 stop:6560 length:2358 start_codon:yes stop_codon:yes gene_type:complete